MAVVPADNSFAVRLNRGMMHLSRHWLRYMLLLVAIYVGVPFTAPVMMRIGWTEPAYTIYTMYSFVCHQYAFRSWFLFGEQPVYPRAAANLTDLKSFESYSTEINQGNSSPVDLTQWDRPLIDTARAFVGDTKMGYKVAFCERDVAIYGGFLIGGLIFAIPYVRRRLRPVPLWLYGLLGIVPIGIDGFSQLLSEPPLMFWAQRESTPAFRTLTGLLFGLMNAWLAFPYLEASMRDAYNEIRDKFRRRDERLVAQSGKSA
ncbi:MAG TPA: DUF2085 domain-containing protein [Aggregatilineales bacterium]|nr:DUF2085 domain-containing protein [Aggregatilineales bacterium]